MAAPSMRIGAGRPRPRRVGAQTGQLGSNDTVLTLESTDAGTSNDSLRRRGDVALHVAFLCTLVYTP